MQPHSVKTKEQQSRNLVSRGEVKETKQIERVQSNDKGPRKKLEPSRKAPSSPRRTRTYTLPRSQGLISDILKPLLLAGHLWL